MRLVSVYVHYLFPPATHPHTLLGTQELTGGAPKTTSNGGRDVFVDIGDKSWGVTVCQRYFEKQSQNSGGSGSSSKLQFGPENTLHVGDQFLSAGANDFRARSVGTTAWIASPEETVYVYLSAPSTRLPPLPPNPFGQDPRGQDPRSAPVHFKISHSMAHVPGYL